YLASREAAVAVRPSDYKLPGGVNVVLDLAVKELLHLLAELRLNPGNEDVDHILFDSLQHLFFVLVKIVMLGGNDYCMHFFWCTVVVVFNCNLALGVGP